MSSEHWLKVEDPKKSGGVILTLVGESGSGKTYSALRIARGFAGDKPFAVLDTEEGRAGHYAAKFRPWKHAIFPGPWSSDRYVEALDVLERQFEVVVIDQASSEWESAGGVLDAAESGRSKKGPRLEGAAKWTGPKRAHARFREKIVHSRCKLLIVLLREKELIDWDSNPPKKLGFVAVQDKRFVHDSTVQIRLIEDGRYQWQKKMNEDLRACFPRDGGLLTEETGRLLRAWSADSVERQIQPVTIEDETVDDKIVEVLEEAEAIAAQGLDALKAWWSMLSPAMKRALEPEKDRLKALAEKGGVR